ncbi:MAG: acyl carrier protein [Oscillospiraceae bacterium]|nr:acyl carrier protein [Oscillospiraceae bacterium]MCI8877452.1 acyl carrier protein [Oscillospiraceae bacterium]
MDFEKVRGIIAETLVCDQEKVTDSALLVEDLGTDSLTLVELAMAIEETTGVTVEDEALPGLKTVGDVMAYLKSRAE